MRQVIAFNNKNWELPNRYYLGLHFIAEENSTIGWEVNGNITAADLKYSLDFGKTWSQWDKTTINLSAGDTICFKGLNTAFGNQAGSYLRFVILDKVEAKGNIMSIIDDGACTTTTIPTLFCFRNLFFGCSGLTSAPELPATTLQAYCYHNMFSGCTNITKMIKLPSTTLANYCYNNMFAGTGITNVLANHLPATILQPYCYRQMFVSCSSLSYVECLATNISAINCLQNWTLDVSETGTFVKKAGINWPSGASGIPTRWTVIDTPI